MAEPLRSSAKDRAIAVVVGTRDRALGAKRTVASLLSSPNPLLQLRVVDQSLTDETAVALEPFATDARMVHHRTTTIGIAAARNLGIEASSAPIIAFTDDDCAVEPGWIEAIAAPFALDEQIGVVLGSVLAAPYDRSLGFIPAYQVPRPFVAKSIVNKWRIEGIGACMGVRRSTWESIGGFDELLGAGGVLRAGEESDFIMRALIRGFRVSETPHARVTHSGFRSWGEGHSLIEGYMYGLGAANAKMLRLGGSRAMVPVLALAWRWLIGQPALDLNHRPPHLARLRAFVSGAHLGLRLPLDRGRGLFLQ